MDRNIATRTTAAVVLVNATTQQECTFDDQAAADDFLANVEGPDDWSEKAEASAEGDTGTDAPAPATKARKTSAK